MLGGGPDLGEVEGRLREVIADLEAESAAVAAATAEGPDDEHDAEGSTVGYERARLAGLLARARRDLAGVEDAAVRVSSGTYGVCTGCGGAIGAERLAALPATKVCVTCAFASRSAGRGGGGHGGERGAGAFGRARI